MLKVDPAFADVAKKEAEKAGIEYKSYVNRLDSSHPSYDRMEKAAWRRLKRAVAAIERKYRMPANAKVTRKPKR